MKEKIQKIRQNKLIQKHKAKIKFVLVGGTNFLLDLGIYTLLANVLGWNQIVANIISVTISMIFSFYMNYTFVWRSQKNLFETVAGFFVVSMFSNYVVQNLVILIMSAIIGEGSIQNVVCKCCASGVGMITNYFGYKIVFTSDKVTNLLKKIQKKIKKKK